MKNQLRSPYRALVILSFVISFFLTPAVQAQTSLAAKPETKNEAVKPDAILLTVFLKHDQSMNLEEIQKIQEKQGFFKAFPPEGTTVVNWFVMMGIGQVVTLEVPASKLRDVNVAIEKTGWKAFKSEYYPTYDLYPVIQSKLTNKSKKAL